MDKLEWHDGLSVGVTEIDNQHKVIFGIVNKLIDNEGVFVSSEIVADVLNELQEYSGNHFSLEEKYMEASNYEWREEHKKRHLEFRKKVVEFHFDVANFKHATPEQITKFLFDWWYNHILDEDQGYSEAFIAHGLS